MSLDAYPRPDAVHRHERQRGEDPSRHRSARSPREAGASDDDSAAVVRELDTHRPGAREDGRAPAELNGLAKRVVAVAAFLRCRITGDYATDEFGFDPQFNEAFVMPVLRTLFTTWFRVEVAGIENLPAAGAALVVANHAGVLPLDGLMLSVAVHDKHPTHRALRLLAADLVCASPVLGATARKAGHTMACPADAHRLLVNGELTAVFPEGYKGLGKCFRDRYKLRRFGRGGFVSAALRTKAPIIPCSIVGSEEIYPMIGDLRPLARVLGLPYFPITALFPWAGPAGLIPLPSKWHVEFGAQIRTEEFDDTAHEDPMVRFELTDRVRETIQWTLYRQLSDRRNVFLG
jgi:1-acyl-sn-glycerol-3-phosphate acyltransferase